jgi:hypothetical protein
MTFNEAIMIHLIHNGYSFQRASIVLEAFDIPFPCGGYHDIHELFKSYIHSYQYITNNVLMKINFAAHILSGHSHQQQETILTWLLTHKKD